MEKYTVNLEYTISVKEGVFDGPADYQKTLETLIRHTREFTLPPKETKVTVTPGE